MHNGDLHSWKEIADYLGVTVRTAQNWEKERGLPVRRLPGGRARVLAVAQELDEWKLSGQAAEQDGEIAPSLPGPKAVTATAPAKRLILVAGLAALLLAVLAFGYLAWMRPGQPKRWTVDGDTMIVLDSHGHEVWRWSAEYPFGPYYTEEYNRNTRRYIWIGDLDGDGDNETLLTPLPELVHKIGTSAPLLCFDKRGNLRWQFIPGRVVTSAKPEQFPNLYIVANFQVARFAEGRPTSILVSAIQIPDYPNQIALLNVQTGKSTREYWHSGYIGDYTREIELADLDGNGVSEIYLAGGDIGSRRITLVALDPDRFEGASFEDNSEYRILGFAPGREMYRVLFPHSCLNLGSDMGAVTALFREPAGIGIGVNEVPLDKSFLPILFYYLSLDGRFLRMSPSNDFRLAHEAAEREGRLDHTFKAEEQKALESAVVVLPPSYKQQEAMAQRKPDPAR